METKRSRQKTGGAEEMDSNELLELLNEADKQEDFDAAAVKKLLLDFERAASTNQTNRALHPQDPSKWLDSEVALDESIKALHVLGSAPSLFPVVVELKTHESLVGLLAHENVDVGGSVLGLIAELLDGTDNEEEAIYVQALAGEFAEAGLLTSMIANWERLRQLGEGSGPVVVATLHVLSLMIEQDEESCDALVGSSQALQLCCDTITPRKGVEAAGEVELLASEVLAMALQGATSPDDDDDDGEDGTAAVPADEKRDMHLMETLLVVIHGKGRKAAESAMDAEVVSNAADAVATLLLQFGSRHRATFAQCEGVQLICKLLESKGCGMLSAVRVLSFALQDQSSCEVFVESLGLKPLFRWWRMNEWPKKLASKHQWGPEEWRALREHLTSVMCSLCVHLGAGTVAQLRLWKKFDDEETAVAQTVQMWSEHRSHLLRKGLMVGETALEDVNVAGDDGDDAELVLQRLSEGHIALTQLTIILVCLAALPSPLQQSLRNKVSAAAKLASVRFGEVAALIHDHKRRTGDDYTAALDDLKDVFC